jgi:hypothetical protein
VRHHGVNHRANEAVVVHVHTAKPKQSTLRGAKRKKKIQHREMKMLNTDASGIDYRYENRKNVRVKRRHLF